MTGPVLLKLEFVPGADPKAVISEAWRISSRLYVSVSVDIEGTVVEISPGDRYDLVCKDFERRRGIVAETVAG